MKTNYVTHQKSISTYVQRTSDSVFSILQSSNKENTSTGSVEDITTREITNDGKQSDEENCDDDRFLDVLALAAENDALKKQVATLILEKEEVLRNSQPSSNIKDKQIVTAFRAELLRKNKKKDEFVYYTGLTNEQFQAFNRFLIPSEQNDLPFEPQKSLTSQKKMKMKDHVLLVLMKLRQNFDFVHIGKLFEMSQQDAGMIFRDCILYMYFRCGSVSMWPHRDVIIKMMPDTFRQEFPTIMIIIDGTEVKIQRPSSMTHQSQCYSDYKSSNTLKGLVGIERTKRRCNVCLHAVWGSISDKELTVQSGFLQCLKELKQCGKLNEGDSIMVDKGFRIQEEVEELGFHLNIPPFSRNGSQMSSSEIRFTEKIARHRVHVERAIARIKSYKILSHRIDLSLSNNSTYLIGQS